MVAGFNRYGPKILHAPVKLEAARLSPFTGGGTLTGLIVANPPGWESDRAMSIGSIRLSVVPRSLLGDHIIVREVFIDQPDFVYETKVIASNIGDLLKGMNSSASDSSRRPGEDQERTADEIRGRPPPDPERHRSPSASATGGDQPAPAHRSTWWTLGKAEGGITSDQLTLAIMRSVTSEIVATATKAVGQLGSTLGASASSKLKSLFGSH